MKSQAQWMSPFWRQKNYFDWEGPLPYLEDPLIIFAAFRAPVQMERFLLLGVWLCFDTLLYTFTFLPLRLVHFCFHSTYVGLTEGLGRVIVYPRHIVAVADMLVLVIGFTTLMMVDESLLVHILLAPQKKNMLGVHIIVLLEILRWFDATLLKIGRFANGAFYHAAASYANSAKNSEEPPSASLQTDSGSNQGAQLKMQRWWLLLTFIISTGYVALHSVVLFLEVTAIKVAISSENSLLLASLLKFGFDSLKAIPSKVTTQQELLVVLKADTHERFKWIIFTSLSVVVELAHLFEKSRAAAWVELPNKLKSGITAFALVLTFQVLTTWFKHFTISCNNKLVGLQVGLYYTHMYRGGGYIYGTILHSYV
jgi:hypothetical protein